MYRETHPSLLILRPSSHQSAPISMSLVRIVMFRFKADASPEAVQEACARLLNLKNDCLDPETHQPYIKSLTGGKDASIEGNQDGMQYAFVIEFKSTADRDYFAKTDPVHLECVENVTALLEKVIVVDYDAGKF
ncbi:Stress responsive A/B barrel domain-containing protein [Mycena sanguinolenta]|uniref:Stress responsive A/B barrel domain-containing protein n=1 Tax=Mycena sanguinolenta TaxID=230812 RepID=A0A8H6YVK0_9AGAR|nr:Stress responsive A/B barrel domain-containing protein [Mycena sanguinolenta]